MTIVRRPMLRLGRHELVVAVMAAAMFTATLPEWTVVTSPRLTVSDVLFLLGACMLLPALLRRRIRASPLFLTGALLVIGTSLISIMVVPYTSYALQGALRITYAMVLLPSIFIMWRPALRVTGTLGAAYVAGTCTSVVTGLLTGPDDEGSGRLVGLSLHPNGLALTVLLAMVLIPFVVQALPRLRPLGVAVALLLAYGLYESGSRGALIALLATVAVHIILERSAIAGIFTVGFASLFVLFQSRLVSSNGTDAVSRLLGGGSSDDSDAQRELAFNHALELIQLHPFVGNGYENIRLAHNVYLQAFATLGVFGLIGFLLILVSLGLPVLKGRKTFRRLSYLAVAYAFLGASTDAIFDTEIWAPLALCVLAREIPADRGRDPSFQDLRRSTPTDLPGGHTP